jgi:nitrous oxidase accessory protein NosD
MKRGEGDRRGLKGTCGVLTWLLLSACGPATPAETRSPDSPAPPGARPVPAEQTPPGEQPAPEEPTLPEPTGRSWYVSTKGSDAGAGTQESPLRTLGRAVALAQPGEVIRVLPGVYAEQLLLESRGEGAQAIILRGEGTPRPTLVPSDRARSSVILVRGRWSLENLHVDVGGAPMMAVTFESGATGSFLAGSELNGGTSGAGVLVEGPAHVTIQDNHLHHFIKPGDDSHGVAVVGPSRDIVIRRNDIHHTSGDSIQCEGEVPAVALRIEGNQLHDEGENGVDLKRCQDVLVRGNQLWGFPNTAIRAPGSSAGEAVVIHESARGVVIEGNTLSRAGRGVSVLSGEDIRVEGNTLREIRDFPEGNGQGIRIAGGRNVQVVDNTVEGSASYGLMLAADGEAVTGLTVRNNRLCTGTQPLLLRLGSESFRPGLLMDTNHYAPGGVLKADGVRETLTGALTAFQADFSGEQLLLSSQERLEVWQRVLGVDEDSSLLE